MSRYLNFGYTALLIGGVLLAIGGLVYSLTYVTPFSTEVHTTGFVAGSALRLAGQVGVLLGLTAMSVRQLERTGRTGLVVLVGLTTWMAMWIGMTFTDLFKSVHEMIKLLDPPYKGRQPFYQACLDPGDGTPGTEHLVGIHGQFLALDLHLSHRLKVEVPLGHSEGIFSNEDRSCFCRIFHA